MNRDTSVSNYDSSIQHLDATSLAEVVATRSCSLFIGCAQCGDRALRRLTPRSKETLERYYLASVHALRAQPGESILEVGCGFGNLPLTAPDSRSPAFAYRKKPESSYAGHMAECLNAIQPLCFIHATGVVVSSM
jgi:hypothetical protein